VFGVSIANPLDGVEAMAELVNLRRARKRALRQEQEQIAASNRAVHGRPKGARKLDHARAEKARRELDSHKIDGKGS
jgi:hypothetical protein